VKNILIVLSIIGLSACGGGISSGSGKKIGQVVKMGQYGMICDTYEGELMRGGLTGGTGVNGNSFHFSVKRKKLFDKLSAAMEAQQEIEVSYEKANFSGPCSGEAGVWVTDFRVLSQPDRPKDEREILRRELQKKLKELE